MQDRQNFLELHWTLKINLSLIHLIKDCPHFKVKFPKFHNFILTPTPILKIWRKKSEPHIIQPFHTTKHNEVISSGLFCVFKFTANYFFNLILI